jgi:hypothetical protein
MKGQKTTVSGTAPPAGAEEGEIARRDGERQEQEIESKASFSLPQKPFFFSKFLVTSNLAARA